MNLKSIISLAFLSLSVVAGAQSIVPGQFIGRFAVADKAVPSVKAFDLCDVTLLPSRFRENMQRDSAWIANIDVNRLVHSFRNSSGAFAALEGGYDGVKKFGGWESLDCDLRGHTTGHLMSAIALMYASTGDEKFKAKGDSIVDALALVQEAYGNGYLSAFPEGLIDRNIQGKSVWAPWYTLHKILSGLIDQYLYLSNPKALDVAKNMGDWAYNKLNGLDDDTRKKMIRNEFGGVNEAFYNLYALTGDSRYCNLAEFFYHNEVIDPLKDRDSDFGTRHTNTFIPKVLAEVRKYELTGDTASLGLSEFFWNQMIDHHTYAPGASSDKEHFFDPQKMSDHLSGYSGETCCTYNMLKLSRHLFANNPSVKIADYYERALYNQILGQQNPETGMVCYFLPLKPGAHKVYSTPEHSFWCCVGSGFENHAKYGESIYFHGDDDLYVNLYIPSEVNWADKGLTVRQETAFPCEDVSSFFITADNPTKAALKLRYPSWAGKAVVKVNGKKVSYKANPGEYITIDRTWKMGDKLELTLPMSLRTEGVTGDDGLAAVFYGPVLLAGELGTEGMEAPAPTSDHTKHNDYYTYDYHIPAGLNTTLSGIDDLHRQGDGLKFVTSQGQSLIPLYDMHNQRYVVYWTLNN